MYATEERLQDALMRILGMKAKMGLMAPFTPAQDKLPVLRCADHASEEKALSFLESQVKKCKVKSKSAQKGLVELNLEIRLQEDDTDFVNELSEIAGVESAVLVSYNGDYMG